ncbi:MAG: VWA domain-containing protein [Ruminococcaceae bacterium]|nr:VWA domain-containing protein [Oscillospiraceae bacterium]
MTAKMKTSNRIMSLILSVALLITCIPMILTAATTGTSTYAMEADSSTINDWKNYFPTTGDIHTLNAGGIWTDKSVFKAGTTIDGKNFTIGGNNSFLVALSAIGSNMSVTGKAAVPTDTVMVLDTSGSMDGAPARAMINAVNVAMNQLMNANKGNRVAIVFFDSETTTYLPLAHYETSDSNGRFLNINNSGTSISLNSNVTDGNGNDVSASYRSWSVSGGTYTALGLKQAMNVLTATSNVLDQDVAPRIPVVMLFTDGIPTFAANDFTNPPTNEYNAGIGNGQNYGAGVAEVFATELTAAYVKAKISEKYGSEYGTLFYTLGKEGTEDNSLREAILDPENKNTTALKNAWTDYNALSTGSTVTVDGERFTKISTELSADYVDGYFDVDSYQSGTTTLEEALAKAFSDVVAEIVAKSVYSPTLLEGSDHNLSGYVSFVDKIGAYMKVTEIKGIMTGGTLFTGSKLAEEVYKSSIGQLDEILAAELQASIAARLDITIEQVRELLYNAWNHGQIAYDPQTGEYSDWFGWLSDAQGTYLGVWYEGMEIPVNAAHVNKSFIYLGIDGDTNMMYTTVRIREKVNAGVPTGEQDLAFAVPASLLPKITYNVELDENNNVINVEAVPETPIHLIYEVGFDPDINEFNLKDKVSASYLAANTDPTTGEVYFYTNAWERTPDADGKLTGYGKVNTYSYFKPSRQNDRFYYQEDSLIYSDTNGTVYNGSDPANASGNLYYYYYYYAKNGNTYSKVYEYHVIPKEVLAVAEDNGDGTWTIKQGTVRSDYASGTMDEIVKADNASETLPFSHEPFHDPNSYAWDDTTHVSIVGVTLANNGRIAVMPESGIKITKELDPNVTLPNGADTEFVFDLTYPGVNGRSKAYSYRYVNGELAGAEETVTFLNGKASVTLKAGETIYIGEMTTGTITVTERTYIDYVVQSVSLGGNILNGTTASAALSKGKMQEIVFVNTARGTGNFTVAKEIIHNYGAGYTIPVNNNTKFDIELTFDFDGKPLSGEYVVTFTDGIEAELKLNGTVGEKIIVTLRHDEQFTVYGLPEGTVVTATEVNVPDGFTPSYENGVSEAEITANATSQIVINNVYEATVGATPSITVTGSKTVANHSYNGAFEFTLQRYKSGAYIYDSSWEVIETETVNYDSFPDEKSFAFDYVFPTFDEVGTYIYRVKETNSGVEGMLYDGHLHSFQIDVTDNDMDGKLEATVTTTRAPQVTVVEGASGWTVNADFVNSYTSDHVVPVYIDVQKEIDNGASGSPLGKILSGFKFALYDENGTLVEELSTNSAGAILFTLSFDGNDVGIHKYTVKEVFDPSKVPAGWKYNDDTVEIEIEISWAQSGHLEANIYTATNIEGLDNYTDRTLIGLNADNTAVFTFENTYAPGSASLEVDFVEKEVKSNAGQYVLKDNEFSFAVYEVINGIRATDPISRGTNAANGKVTFDTVFTYTEVGEYHYEIVEVKPDNAPDYITYDTTVYKMIVHVTDNGGQLVATPVVETVAGNNITFKNTYTAEPTTLVIDGTKILTGRPLLEHDFQFILSEVGTSNVWYAMNGVPTDNKATFAFEKLTFVAPGEYTYKVSEYDPATKVAGYFDGVRYDDTEYTVVVKVTDNGAGKLVATYTVDGDASKQIEFNNTYNPEALDIKVIGTKALLGRDLLSTDKFTFELYGVDYDETTQVWTKSAAPIATAENAIDGSIVFVAETVNKAGTYRYIVTERNTGNAGITFDATEWQVTVNVTDNQHGVLSVASVIFVNERGQQNGMVFVNSYTATGDVLKLQGTKTLTGRTLNADEFAFTLYNSNSEWETETAIQTVTNGADGSFAFDEIAFDKVGTYYYLVKEDKGNLAGVTYDETVYRVKVEVTDDLNGKLVITCTLCDENDTAKTAIEFVNTYAVTNPDTADNVLNWLIPVVASGVVMTALVVRKKKNDNEDEE